MDAPIFRRRGRGSAALAGDPSGLRGSQLRRFWPLGISASMVPRHSSQNRRRPVEYRGALTGQQLRRVLVVVQDRLEEDITLDDLASAACMSRFHFVRAFKAAVGKPPHRWLVGLRMERAKEL